MNDSSAFWGPVPRTKELEFRSLGRCRLWFRASEDEWEIAGRYIHTVRMIAAMIMPTKS